MLTFASTNFFVAGPELPCVESVVRLTLTDGGVAGVSGSTKCHEAVAFAVNELCVALLMTTVHVRGLPVRVGVQVDWVSGDGVTVTDSEFSEGLVPDGIAVDEIVNVCA